MRLVEIKDKNLKMRMQIKDSSELQDFYICLCSIIKNFLREFIANHFDDSSRLLSNKFNFFWHLQPV
jgi:hypothetical protein